jgi:serine/threonine-protein kinase RsbW
MNTSRDDAFTTNNNGTDDGSDIVQVTIPGLTQFIGVARQTVDAVSEQIHLSPDDRMAVRLAVGEACNNAVFHAKARADKPVGRVVVACRILPEALEIDITNDGNGFHPTVPPRVVDAMPEATAESGRGMPLMQMLMDSVEYLSERGNTVVRLRKLRGDSAKDHAQIANVTSAA